MAAMDWKAAKILQKELRGGHAPRDLSKQGGGLCFL